MKFTKHRLPKSAVELEEFVKAQGLRASDAIPYKDRKIYIAETDLETTNPKEFPWGFYQTAWFISRKDKPERFEGGNWLEFDAMHDSEENWTVEAKHKARLGAARASAMDFINKLEEVGY